MRTISITKSGKTTIIEIKNPNSDKNEIYGLNSPTNVNILGDVLVVLIDKDKWLHIQYDELEDKLSSTDIRDYLVKASVLFLFNQ